VRYDTSLQAHIACAVTHTMISSQVACGTLGVRAAERVRCAVLPDQCGLCTGPLSMHLTTVAN